MRNFTGVTFHKGMSGGSLGGTSEVNVPGALFGRNFLREGVNFFGRVMSWGYLGCVSGSPCRLQGPTCSGYDFGYRDSFQPVML